MTIWKYAYNETEKKVDIVNDNSADFVTNLYDGGGYFDSLIYATQGVKATNKAITDGTLLVKKCKNCGKYYFMTINEKYWFEERGVSVPKRCRVCRGK